jgi:hypothetical protein
MRGSAARVLLPGLAVLGLVGIVAVAATGSTRSGSDERRRPPDVVLDTFFSFSLVLLIPAAALLVYGLMQRRAIALEMASGKYRRAGLLSIIAFVVLFGIAWNLLIRRRQIVFGGDPEEPVDLDEPVRSIPPPPVNTYEPEFAWIPVLVVLVLVAVGVGAYMVAARRRRRAFRREEVRLAEDVADTLDDSLDDLRAEPDPRRAVIAAYARLERALAASGVARSRQETTAEYVTRALGRLEVDDGLVRRLADLFTRAKFSHHAVDEMMKHEAIAALARIRDELRAAARARLEESTKQLVERAATS